MKQFLLRSYSFFQQRKTLFYFVTALLFVLLGIVASKIKVEEDVMNKVIEMNKRYSNQLEENEEVYRGIQWKLNSLEWDNLFNYGTGNSVDFSKLNGIVGIFGKNYSGKSSIIDSLLYTIYNSTSKNNRKNFCRTHRFS